MINKKETPASTEVKKIMTINELRIEKGLKPIKGGDNPLKKID